LQDLFAKIDALLNGIDRQEDDPKGGYWKTSDGARVGTILLRNLKELLTRELTQPDPEGGLLGLDDLRNAWNAQADAANSWDELGLDEIICFAQQAIVRQCRPAVAPLAQPGPWVDGMPCDFIRTLLRPAYEPGDGSADGAQLVSLAWWHPAMGCDSLQIVVENARAIIARQGRPAVAPEPGEVDELVQWLTLLRDNSSGLATMYNDRLTRVATLLQQQAAPTPAVVPELNWSEERQPCEECRYDHCIAETPFGRFLISWKGWKEYLFVTVDESPFGDCLESWNSVEAAKSWCQAEYSRRLAVAVGGYLAAPTPIVPPTLIRALELAEAGLADIGDADHEPGDDLAWAEARAARDLPDIRQALNLWRDQVAAVAPVAVSERPWEREGWCDAEGRCWRFDSCENGWWSYGDPTDLMGSSIPWTHMVPHWAIPLPATTKELQS
jgi:hypothetical protein